MKRRLAFTACIAALVAALTAFVPTEKRARAQTADLFTAAAMEEKLSAFLGDGQDGRRDRTSFGAGERAAAEYIYGVLNACGYEEGAALETQSVGVDIAVAGSEGTENRTLTTQNVIATYNPGMKYSVVVGANYDNLYSDIAEIGYTGSGDEGVADNATGTAAVLALAEAFASEKPKLDFTVKFVFFGACSPGAVGSSRYVAEKVADGSVLLMVNVMNAAAERITVYSDETDSAQSEYFLGAGENRGTEFVPFPRQTPLFPRVYSERLGYSHIGMLGDHISFFDAGVPVVALSGVEADGFTYATDGADTYASFRRDYPDYGAHMADVASMVYDALTAAEFYPAALAFGPDYDYSFFTHGDYASIALLCFIVLLGVALLVAVRVMAKKFPPAAKKRNVKVAVFGMEYEQKTDNDIYIDPLAAGKKGKETDPFDNKG